MRAPSVLVRPLVAALAAGLLVAGPLPLWPAHAAPVLAEAAARPTVDPAAPTPTAPPAAVPQGSAPDGSTVGGAGLDTRGLVVVPGAPPLPPGIDAHGWLVADAGTGEVLAAQDPHGRYYPASTLKTLTLLTLHPQLDPALVVQGTTEDEAVEGSRVGLVRGGAYPVQLLFQAMVMQSGNDAANALARAAGGVTPTLAAMNATAERIGALDTVAGTPSGLDVAGQSSSPYDLALIMRQLALDPAIVAIMQTPTAQMPGVEGITTGYQIQNQDALLTEYPGTIGAKNGFTDAARHTFVAAAERDGRRLVVSLMQAERSPVPTTTQAELLLDWGFATPAGGGVGRLVEPGEVSTATAAPVPSATPGQDGVLTSREADRQAAPTPAAAAQPDRGESPLVPIGLGVGALAIVAATVVGRRRALVRQPPGSGPPRP
ncbi:D-alanyl-D-alanine carboxypeptidase [Modestobacter sp. I12A-02628]|uniref:D-alanyl-D-alanine carboxypeptidase n=1 Tax=Goekera deserti TaxID=2497753 RepID=A0A7K3W891_9ACTN|nr:serine hydrolase [Goekera deserti]MPR00274.1 D-alanyl-D-alanine carboxypeptidase [Goekera deserti]NDI49448.1 D-alanyl-D-alanine carboxypeptidase [Goekera deserti]NEL52678.1 D-alanyl-D-alanine carboxypeptidase [Goekera deserti]